VTFKITQHQASLPILHLRCALALPATQAQHLSRTLHSVASKGSPTVERIRKFI